MEVISPMLSSTACNSIWMSDSVSKHHPFSFIFNLGNSEINGGSVWRVGRKGNDNHVVSHKLCGVQGCMGGCVFVMKEQYDTCSNFLLRSHCKLHNRSQLCLPAHNLLGDGLCGWVLEFFNIFCRFAGGWLPWTLSSSTNTRPALKCKCH
jgi:hypothetical protein